jgi:hypothetical protein
MNGELLKLETAKKLKRYEEAIKYINKYMYSTPSNCMTLPIKKEFKIVLDILEGK